MAFYDLIQPLVGGVLIGLATSFFLWMKGRVFGVSGIFAGVLFPKKGDTAWRIFALLGFFSAGFLFQEIAPQMLGGEIQGAHSRYLLAGLLVGFGTQLGNGCTSGHGVCGISRLSPRSLIATLTFMSVGILTVAVIRSVGWVL
jgi:uncharacterized membrane protein YedE/YeeE